MVLAATCDDSNAYRIYMRRLYDPTRSLPLGPLLICFQCEYLHNQVLCRGLEQMYLQWLFALRNRILISHLQVAANTERACGICSTVCDIHFLV